MRCCHFLIRETQAAEDAKVRIGGRCTEQELKRSDCTTCLTWSAIDEVSGSGQSLDPIGRRHADMNEKAADTVVQCPKDAFSLPILGRSVWTRKPKSDTMGGKMRTQSMVIELLAIVGLEGNQQGAHIGMEIQRTGESFRLSTQGECPHIMW